MPSVQAPISFYYYTRRLTLRCNRPLKTTIYISLCSTTREYPLFGPWEKWSSKIHFVPPNLRTTDLFLISWFLSTFLTPPSCGFWPSYSYFASFCSTAVSRKDRRETQGIRLSFQGERNKRNSGKSSLL